MGSNMKRVRSGRVALCVVAAVGIARARSQDAAAIPALDLTPGPATRLLVIAPHPDDDTLAAGGLISRVVRNGGAVHVVWLTSGDGFPEGVETSAGVTHPRPRDFRTYGGLREGEARAAAGELGLVPRSLSFLGFPDGGLCELASTYLSVKRAFKSPYTNRISPPLTEQVIRGVRYRGTDVRREIERIVISVAPTLLVVPHQEDEHPDHCSTHIFTAEAVAALAARGRPRPRILYYLVHYQQWPLSADAGGGAELQPPAGFPPAQGRWVSFALTPEEIEAKRVALLTYRSQLLVIGRFMMAFARSNELFLDGEPTSPAECWCNSEKVATESLPGHYRRRPARR
jgi:LmbE family N-acetylglucosaminyl deacetylase